ncbi:MAG TPA: hypothetical protein VGR35_14530 [Tepidisphaeraceae bacterium]|nr:hypothetical protein [Tepidisphaeraceae bacterium]
MSKLLIVALSGIMFVTVGCQNRDDEMDRDTTMTGSSTASETRTRGGADDCSHCAGKQTAKADGTCPMCNMKVK